MLQSPKTFILQAIAIGGGLASLVMGAYAIVGGAASVEGTVAIVLLLGLALSLGAALVVQGLKYGRAERYAGALSQIFKLTDRISLYRASNMTGAEATALCDRIVNELARILCQVSGHTCFVSIEILTPTRESRGRALKRSIDYEVVNLSRDSASEHPDHKSKKRHSIDGNSAYSEIFQSSSCGAHYLCDDVADGFYHTTELSAEERSSLAGGGRLRRRRWPLPYRSTLVTKICQYEPCRAQSDHGAIAFLRVRSPSPGAFDATLDVELLRHMSKAVSPIVSRCMLANKPALDFRRQSAAALPGAGPMPA